MAAQYVWQESYSAAMLELDPAKLPLRIAVAQEAIAKRLEELENAGARSGESGHERLALSDAQQTLRALARTIRSG